MSIQMMKIIKIIKIIKQNITKTFGFIIYKNDDILL